MRPDAARLALHARAEAFGSRAEHPRRTLAGLDAAARVNRIPGVLQNAVTAAEQQRLGRGGLAFDHNAVRQRLAALCHAAKVARQQLVGPADADPASAKEGRAFAMACGKSVNGALCGQVVADAHGGVDQRDKEKAQVQVVPCGQQYQRAEQHHPVKGRDKIVEQDAGDASRMRYGGAWLHGSAPGAKVDGINLV